ncbi:MAG: heme o synthase [Actinomycetes bacterium]
MKLAARSRAYVALMKLRVVELLIITTIPALVLAQHKFPSMSVAIATLIGGTLAAGSANAYNQVFDRDIDQLMERTKSRPLVKHVISPFESTIFATVVGLISLLIFWIFTTPLATLLTFIAIAYYVLIYTALLKRNTRQNIVWGGAAGCMPVLIGWAAVTNSLSISAVIFFFVIFFWTPPHFWALAIKYKEDYSRAKIPMLPVVASHEIVASQMWWHSVAMVICSSALGVTAELSMWYQGIAAVLGITFLYLVWNVRTVDSHKSEKVAAKIFHGSITYLSVLSLAITIFALI